MMTIIIYDRTTQGRQSWGLVVAIPQILAGGRRVVAGGRVGRGLVLNYYYMLSFTGSMFESGDF